jgi:hypothetical protein
MNRLLKTLTVLAFFGPAGSFASDEIGVLGGLNFWLPAETHPGVNFSSSAEGDATFGSYYRTDLLDGFDFETGFFSVKKHDILTLNGTDQIEKTASYVLPLLIRTNFVPGNFLSIAAGPYFEAGTSAGISMDGVSYTYASQGLKHTDFGVMGSIQLAIPITEEINFLLDGRYLLGFIEQRLDTTQRTLKNRHIQILGGFSFLF